MMLSFFDATSRGAQRCEIHVSCLRTRHLHIFGPMDDIRAWVEEMQALLTEVTE